MAIPVQNPINVVSTELNLNSFWLSNLNITAFDPNKPIRLVATVEKVQDNGDGTFTKAPLNIPKTRGSICINDLDKSMSTDAKTISFKSPVTGQDLILYTADIIKAVTLKVQQLAEDSNVL